MWDSSRERIHREHEALRGSLEEIELLLARWEAGVSTAAVALRERGLFLYERLSAHIELEEAILAPALRAGASGFQRAEELESEHREQRELLAFLRARMAEEHRPTELVVRELRSFAAYLRDDMSREEDALDALDALDVLDATRRA